MSWREIRNFVGALERSQGVLSRAAERPGISRAEQSSILRDATTLFQLTHFVRRLVAFLKEV